MAVDEGKTHSRTRSNFQIIPLNDKSALFRALSYHRKVVSVISQRIGDPAAAKTSMACVWLAHEKTKCSA
jgi:hypothetical protein